MNGKLGEVMTFRHADVSAGRSAATSALRTHHRSWLRTLRQPSVMDATVVCFPHAGGSLLSVAKLMSWLPDRVRLAVAALPGREPGDDSPAPRRATIVAERLASQIVEMLDGDDPQTPMIFLGNSYGSLLAYETALSLQTAAATAAGPDRLRLIVSGFRSPSLPPTDSPLHRLPSSGLLNELLERFGLTTADLDAIGLTQIESALRADLEACDTYRRRDDAEPLTTRIDVIWLKQDVSVSYDELEAWQDVTATPIRIIELASGHFPWHANPRAVAALVDSALSDFAT
jgi:surfactin synthase thioesterase subunit